MTSFQARRQLGAIAGYRLARSLVSNSARASSAASIHRRVDRLECGGDGLAVLVTGEVHGMAQEANNTGLNPRLGKGRLDSLRDRRQIVARWSRVSCRRLQPVHDGDEDVLDI